MDREEPPKKAVPTSRPEETLLRTFPSYSAFSEKGPIFPR